MIIIFYPDGIVKSHANDIRHCKHFLKYDPHESALLLLIHGRVPAIDDTAGTQITEDDIESAR